MARKKPRSARRESIEHFDDLSDDFEKDSIRGANNAYLKSMKGFREDGGRLSDRDGLVARHLKGLILCRSAAPHRWRRTDSTKRRTGKYKGTYAGNAERSSATARFPAFRPSRWTQSLSSSSSRRCPTRTTPIRKS